MYQEIIEGKKAIALIGLGYVGLPIALAFAKKVKVIGFDINAAKIELLKQHIDPSGEVETHEFENCNILFTHQLEDLRQANFFIVAVPTPIDSSTFPDLKPLLSASRTVGKVLKKGDYVVFESTVYPGCTEEDCIPILEQESGLKFHRDFKVGYSPERINPGDKQHTLAKITKVVSGCCAESLENIAKVYELVVEAGVYRASSIKVAEAAKVIENTQRDLNIALMNELSLIFNKLNINTFEVLEAAGTKWNFLKFTPGLVGGHCIGVDPYYLTYKAKQVGHNPQVILSGRNINDNMGKYVAQETIKKILSSGITTSHIRILLMGITFKENVKDIRNSRVVDIYHELRAYNAQVDVVDAYADSHELMHEYGFSLTKQVGKGYHAVIVAVPHKPYLDLTEEYFQDICIPNGVLIDVKGIYRNKIHSLKYWSL
ncbi:MAG: nucleotide sugar dehydrogenase [Microscillaceae bacterium]|nr:nucleotide sugar dehydrogenase [Microscillaceae bacterium]MDW8459845.1 nucleotide sugar dehydrogenase [Cytophagales bacterium]